MFNPKKILVPTDFSGASQKAAESAADIAARYDAQLLILHVVEENVKQCAIDYLVDYCIEDGFVATFERELMKSSNERLQKQVDSLKATTHARLEYIVKKGDTADVILEELARQGIDLVVMAAQGKTGSVRHAIGGVTDKVVRMAKCPVLVDRF